MASSAGYAAVIKVQGASNVITNEAMTDLSGANPTKTFQITTSGRRVLNPSVTIVVKDGGVTISATLYRIDYLFGKVIFLNYTVTGAITLDGAYFTLWEVTTAKSYEIQDQYADLASDVFASAGVRKRILGVRDAPVTVGRFDVGADDLGGSVTIKSLLLRNAAFIEITPLVGGRTFRGWYLFSKDSIQASPDSLAEATLSAALAARGQGAECAWSNE